MGRYTPIESCTLVAPAALDTENLNPLLGCPNWKTLLDLGEGHTAENLEPGGQHGHPVRSA
eukprot:6137094-Karenia_brevis.AAC.1